MRQTLSNTMNINLLHTTQQYPREIENIEERFMRAFTTNKSRDFSIPVHFSLNKFKMGCVQ